MNRTRDWRRHQRARIRQRRKHYASVGWAWRLGDGRRIDIATEHPRICSCLYCSRPRRPDDDETRDVMDFFLALTQEALAETWENETGYDDDYYEALPRVAYGRHEVDVDIVYVPESVSRKRLLRGCE